MFLGVKWESEVVRSDRNYSLSAVESVVLVKLNLFLPALVELFFEAFLVVYHINYALVNITTVTRAAALQSVIVRCLTFVDQPVFPDAASETSGDHALSRCPPALRLRLFHPGVNYFVSSDLFVDLHG